MFSESISTKILTLLRINLLICIIIGSTFFSDKVHAQCPEIQVVELLGVPGFAETDELIVCGKPDTLAYLIYIEEPGEISGTQMTVDFLPGMIYAGFELTHYDSNTFISVVNPSPEKPRFLLDGVTEGIYIAYIGATTNCSVDKDGLEYKVDLKFNFTYQDTMGNFFNCSQTVTPDRTYNTTIKTPVLNWNRANNMTINRIGLEQCFNVRLTQDGIDANLEDFYLELQNVDLSGSLNLNEVRVNGTPITYDYDNTNKIIRTDIGGTYFNGNTFPNPTDTLFNTGERIQVTYCWQTDECPNPSSFPLKYVAGWGCYGESCNEIERDRTLSIRPTARPEPIAIDTIYSTPEICGNPGTIGLTIFSDQSDPLSGRFTDMKIGFETCNKPSLEISGIRIGGNPIALGAYTWVNDDLVIDFTNLSVDADGGAQGLSDIDGDGFFDDLAGGDTLKVEIDMAYSCTTPPDPGSIVCGVINCDFAQFFVDANRDCGQAFKFFPPINGFEIVDGATFSSTNAAPVGTSFTGIDFGATGTSGAKTRTVEMCYVHEQRGVTPCSAGNSNVALQVFFDGNGGITHDLEVDDPTNIEISVNGTPTITGAPITWDSIGPGQRMLTIDAGLVSIGDTICYTYELTVDTFLCAPNIYATGTHQIVETCAQNGCTCEAIKACESILFRSNPNNTGCSCVYRSGVSDVYRESVGYTDATMTTKIDPQSITGADRNRYLPGDTMMYEAYYAILSPDAFTSVYEWGMGMRIIPLSNGNGALTELQMDARKTELMSFSVKKVGSTTRTEIDFSDIPACVEDGNSSTWVNGVTIYMGSSPYDSYIDNQITTYNNANWGYDFYDNSRIYIQIRNQVALQDCRGVDYGSWNDLGNCWDDFNAKYNFQVGDSLFMRVRIPLIKNPLNEAEGLPFQSARVFQDTWVTSLDEFAVNCTAGKSICREHIPFETFCPSDISVRTDLEIDDCGGTAKHVFSVDNPTPSSWYTNEYRPYFRMKDTDIEVYSPLMYCGNAEITTPGGNTYPLEVQSTNNHDCFVVNGDEYCTVSGGSPGTITFNPLTDNYPGLGIGLNGFRDSLTITYDYCLVCPSEITGLNDYKITYDYQYPYDPPSNPNDYRCNFNANTLANNELDSCLVIGNGVSYYNYFNQDQLVLKDDNESSDATVTDNRQGFPPLTPTIDRNVITSTVPGTSEEINLYTVCAGNTPALTHMGVITTINVNNSVELVNVYDATLTPLTYQYVSTDGTSNTYIVLSSSTSTTCRGMYRYFFRLYGSSSAGHCFRKYYRLYK